ncbi:MAG: CPBP family intramembrane metalloprotease [Clostridiales bacterium]|jgi:membrane protease YdiL (CAAX protease family)|nr:CPBP family intramembrane metalloprotease [Clostridiales bacterium]
MYSKIFSKKDIFYLFTLGLFLNFLITLFTRVLSLPENFFSNYAIYIQNISNHKFYFIFSSTILAPLLEEIICRKFLFNVMRKINLNFAIIFSSLIFGILHKELILIMYATLMGIILCSVYIKYNNIISPIILHLSFNLGAVFFLFFDNNLESTLDNKFYTLLLIFIILIFTFKILKKIF